LAVHNPLRSADNPVFLSIGSSTGTVNLTLVDAGAISGFVTNNSTQTGTVTFRLTGPNGTYNNPLSSNDTYGGGSNISSGSYLIGSLQPGTYSKLIVFVDENGNGLNDPGENSGEVDSINVPTGNITSGISPVIAGGSSIQGQINFTGSNIPQGTLYVVVSTAVPSTTGSNYWLAFSSYPNPNSSQSFTIPNLNSGSQYYVAAVLDVAGNFLTGGINITSDWIGMNGGLTSPLTVTPSASNITFNISPLGNVSSVTGSNTITGSVTGPAANSKIIVQVIQGDQFGNGQVVGTPVTLVGAGNFIITGVPNSPSQNSPQQLYLEAFVDLNNNGTWVYGVDPRSYTGPLSLQNGVTFSTSVVIPANVVAAVKNNITVTIRGSVADGTYAVMTGSGTNNGQSYYNYQSSVPVSGAVISLYDPQSYNNYNMSNSVFMSSTTSSATMKTGTDQWGNSYNYNFEFDSVSVVTSDLSQYMYSMNVSSKGYLSGGSGITFNSSDAGTAVGNRVNVILSKMPPIYIDSLVFSTTTLTISNNNPMSNQVNISFRYIVGVQPASTSNSQSNNLYQYGGSARFIVHSTTGTIWKPFDNGIFYWTPDNLMYVKVDANGNPNSSLPINNSTYTQYINQKPGLLGPLSWNDQKKYSAGYDATMQNWIDGSQLNALLPGNTCYYANCTMAWNGQDSAGNTLPNGSYPTEIQIALNNDFVNSLVVNQQTSTMTVASASIYGVVVDTSNNPVANAAVNVYGPNCGSGGYTDINGNFNVAGLTPASGNQFGLQIQANQFINGNVNNISIPSMSPVNAGTIKLSKGIPITGNLLLPQTLTQSQVVDNMGNPVSQICGMLNVYSPNNPNNYSNQIMMQVGMSSAPYSIWVQPGQYNMQVSIPGFVAISTSVVVAKGSTGVTQNITLTNSSILSGTLTIPPTTQYVMNQINNNGGQIFINIGANSLDNQSCCGSCVNFSMSDLQSGTFTKPFVLNSLNPNTTYNFVFDSNGLFAQKTQVLAIPAGNSNWYTICGSSVIISPGATLKGTVYFTGDVSRLFDNNNGNNNNGNGNSSDNPTGPGLWFNLNVTNVNTLTNYYSNVFVATGTWANKTDWTTNPASAPFQIQGLVSGKHSIDIQGIDGADINPTLDLRTIVIDTTTNKSVFTSSPIYVSNPTGVLQITLNDKTPGKSIDWTKMGIFIAYINSNNGGPSPANLVNNNGVCTVKNLPTGQAIVFGNEYPIAATAQYYTQPTGKVGMFFNVSQIQSGSTTYLNINLNQGTTVFMTITGSSGTISTIANTMATEEESQGQNGPYTPLSVARLQPLLLKTLAELSVQQRAAQGQNPGSPKDMSLPGVLVPSQTTPTSLTFIFSGLNQEVYNIYPITNCLIQGVVQISNPSNNNDQSVDVFPYASSPAAQFVSVGTTTINMPPFNLGAGATVTGSVTRQQAAIAETISVTLTDAVSGDSSESDITFSSTTQNLTGSFTFSNVPQDNYVLAVKSKNYMTVVQNITIPQTANSYTIPSITLSKGATIVGKVITDDGIGIGSNILIQCIADPFVNGSSKSSDNGDIIISTDTITNGQFRVPNVPANPDGTAASYRVWVTLKPQSTDNLVMATVAGVSVPNSQVNTSFVNLIMHKGTSIIGTVVDPNGNPVGNVPVAAYPQDVQQRANYSISANTDNNGKFKINGVYAGTAQQPMSWEVAVNVYPNDPSKLVDSSVRYGTEIRSNINVSGGGNVGVVQLRPANLSLTGTIVGSPGTALVCPNLPNIVSIYGNNYPGALVLIQSANDLATGDPMSGKMLVATSNSSNSSNASFAQSGLTPGTYKIKVFTSSYATYITTITLASSTTAAVTDLGILTLTTGASVSGTISTLSGGYISNSDASEVIATTKDYKNMVFGTLNVNSVTNNVQGYSITGLVPGASYYIALVEPVSNKVFVSPTVVCATSTVASITNNIVYSALQPIFAPKAYRSTLSAATINQTFQNYNVNLSQLVSGNSYDVYFIQAFISKAITENAASSVISTTGTASGILIPMSLSTDKTQVTAAYIPSQSDRTNGNFPILFTGHDSGANLGQQTITFYIGENSRSQQIVNPMIGGNVNIGQNDSSGLSVPAGLQIISASDTVTGAILTGDQATSIALSSGTQISVLAYSSSTLAMSGPGIGKKFSPKSFERAVPAPTTYPANSTILSSVYDMQITLVSGPLATIAQNSSLGITIQISTIPATASLSDINLYHFNTTTNKWDMDAVSPVIDTTNMVLTANVNHLSQFAVFYVPGSGSVTAPVGAVASDLANVIVYPNPCKAGDASYNGAGGTAGRIYFANLTQAAKIRIFTIAGGLVYEVDRNDATTGITYWDGVNKSGNRLASGVYIYYITNPDNGGQKAVGKLAIIK
jgi:hypothetical protein